MAGRLTLCGNFDINILSLGTPEAMREEVLRKMRALAPGGGYVFTQVHNIQPGVSPEAIVAIYDTALALG